jgi:23S rRNA (uracil1939-C5)-methyltransferase
MEGSALSRNKNLPAWQSIQAEIQITALGGRGEGIGEVEGERVFVPFALPGETVRATLAGTRASVDEITKPSPDRIQPFCRHFTHCGGCAVQHLGDDAYRTWKKGTVETALANKRLDVPMDELLDAHGHGRRRVTLHVQFNKGWVEAGFMRARSHDLLDLDQCPILVPALSVAADVARSLAVPFKARAKQLDVGITATESGLDCDIRLAKVHNELDMDTRMDIADIANGLDLARVTVDGELIVERRPPVIANGPGRVAPPPGGFLQATQAGEEALAGLVLDHARGARKVTDLFCGVGPFALRLAAESSVLAVDMDEDQISALSKAVRFCQGLKPITPEVRDLFRNPYRSDELSKFYCVVFDPPRAGAQAQAREIAQSEVPVVIRGSCGDRSFVRSGQFRPRRPDIVRRRLSP